MNNLYLLTSIFSLTTLIQSLKWLWLWQKKDYRLDKMRDYLSLPESRPIVFDYWFKLRLISLFYLTFEFLFKLQLDWLNYFFAGLWIVEIGVFGIKLLMRKNLLIPNFTPKASIIFAVKIIGIIIIIASGIAQNNLHNTLLMYTLDLLLIPFTIAGSILLILPIDYITKKRLFTKAKNHRNSLKNLNVVAISGAFGKTTTKEILTHVLEQKFMVESTRKNQNTDISCARRTTEILPDTQYFVCEVGAINVGDGDKTCAIIQPQTAIITGLNEQHFGLFGSMENIIKAETESLAHLHKNDLVIVNWSSELCHQIVFPDGLRVIKCGIDIEADYVATKIHFDGKITTFDLTTPSVKTQLTTNLFSKGAIQNILHTIAFVLENNLYILDELQPLLTNLSSPDGRLEVYQRDFGQIIFNQYNNYDGIINILDFAKTNKNLVIYLDDIAELGSKSEEIHKKLAVELASIQPAKIILLGRNFSKVIEKELLKRQLAPESILKWDGQNTSEIQKLVAEFTTKNTSNKGKSTVLLLGYLSKNFLD